MNKMTVSVLIVILTLGAGLFILINQKQPISTPSPTALNEFPVTTVQTDMQMEPGSNSYSDQDGIFTVVYPPDYTLDTQDPLHIRIYKRGESQRPQSEMSDGALMVFEPIKLLGITLETWVDSRIQESTNDGTSEITEGKKTITQNGYPGFYYAIRGLGTSQNLILQKGINSDYAVMITYAISDPEQRGYQKEVDAVLTSLRLKK